MKGKKIQTFCQNCHMKCRLFVQVQDNKIEQIKNVMGIECLKAIYMKELIQHQDRVKYPLKRVGDRGNGKWERVSWEEALDIVAQKLNLIRGKYGSEAIATVLGSGHKDIAFTASLLFGYLIGTPNVMDINYLCTVPAYLGEGLTYGERLMGDVGVDYEYSKCILLWGSNPRHNHPGLERSINMGQRKGSKLIVVDPRPPERMDSEVVPADIWLRVRPGTDAALALCMTNIIISQGLYDEKFVKKWCVGFKELAKSVSQYTPEIASETCWIPKEKIVEAAVLFGKSKPSCARLRLGAGSQQTNATQTVRAISNLMAITGKIDIRGGNLMNNVHNFRTPTGMWSELRLPPEVEEKRIGAKEFPLISGSSKIGPQFFVHAHNPSCISAILKGEIRALYNPGCNLIVSELNTKQTWGALKKLEFSVVVEQFMTPTAELADLVLPAAHWLETEIPVRAAQSMGLMRDNYILATRKVIEPAGECWDDRKIVLELAKRMGIHTPWRDINEFNDWMVEGTGAKFKEIQNKKSQQLSFPILYKKYEKKGFKTPSGKVELYSSTLKNLGYDPLPVYNEPTESPIKSPEVAAEYPLMLVNHRNVAYMHSEFRQIPSIRQRYPEPLIEIHPHTASEKGIKEGDEIYIERPGFKHKVTGKAKFVPGLHPKVISCISHWWFPEKPGPDHGCFESNINMIISNEPPYDPIQGNPQVRGLLCRIGKRDVT